MNFPKTLTPLVQLLAASGLVALALPAAAQQAAADATAKNELQTVTVTAQKRKESVLKTAVSVTAMTSADLNAAGVNGTADLVNIVPNVQIGTSDNGNTNIAIRGIGSNNTAEAGDPAAAFHVDGVYLGRPRSAAGTFFDLERVEVLRGPQGTLYGRNATAGAVNVITNKPSFSKASGDINFEVGNYAAHQVEAAVNVPLNSQVALRFAGMEAQRNDYVETSSPEKKHHTEAGRVQAMVKFTPDVSLLLSLDHARFSGAVTAGVPAPLLADKGDAGRINLKQLGGTAQQTEEGAAAELNWNLGPATLTYVGAHRTSKSRNSEDINFGFLVEHRGGTTKAAQDSHELRLSSNDNGNLKWVAGVFTFEETQATDSFFAGGLLGFKLPYINGKSNAVFGQATYSVMPDLRFTLGLRSTKDEKTAKDGLSTNAFPTLGGGPLFVGHTDFNQSWSKSNWRAGAEYDLSKDAMLFVTAATGYKSGGFNNAEATPPGAPAIGAKAYNPESLSSIEGGYKARLMGGRAQVSATAYHYSYKDLQLGSIVDNGAGGVSSRIINAGKASVSGLELESKFKVGTDGRVDAWVGLTQAKYDEFASCVNEISGASAVCSGNALRNAPKVQLGLAYEHALALGADTLRLRVATRYSGAYFNDDVNSAVFKQDAYHRTDLSVRYEPSSDKWWLGAFVRNLEDSNVKASRYPAVIAGQAYTYLGAPRTIGLQGGVHF